MFDDILMQHQQFVEWSDRNAVQVHQQMCETHQRMINNNNIDQFMNAYREYSDAEAERIHEEYIKTKAEVEAAKAEYEKWSKEIEERSKKRRAKIQQNMAQAKAIYEKHVAKMRAAYNNSDIVKEVESHFASMVK